MTHIAHAGFCFGLRLFARGLAIDDCIRDVCSFEKRDRQTRVIAPVHWSIEDLLHDIVYNIVKKVIPWVREEEGLKKDLVLDNQDPTSYE